MTVQKKQLRKLIVFIVSMISVVAITLTIIWIFPGSMYGYGPGLKGLEAVAFFASVGTLIVLLSLSGLFTYVTYRVRRSRGVYGDFRIRRATIWQYWLPMISVLSLFGIVTCLIVALPGPRVLPLVMSRETYWKIEQERKLIVEFSLRPEQARWATQRFQDAVHKGDLATIRRYLRYGADPKAQNGFGQTALHISVLTSNEELVRMFLDMRVDIAARDREGETPLHDACKKRNSEILTMLIDAGADINATSDYGTPLDIAEDYQYPEAVDILKLVGASGSE